MILKKYKYILLIVVVAVSSAIYFFNNKYYLVKKDSTQKNYIQRVVFLAYVEDKLVNCDVKNHEILNLLQFELKGQELRKVFLSRYDESLYAPIFDNLEVTSIGPFLMVGINTKRVKLSDFKDRDIFEAMVQAVKDLQPFVHNDVNGKPLKCGISFQYMNY